MEDLQIGDHEVCNDVPVHHEDHEHHEAPGKKITGTQNKILQGGIFQLNVVGILLSLSPKAVTHFKILVCIFIN